MIFGTKLSELTLNKRSREILNREVKSNLIENMKNSILNKVPKVAPLPLWLTTGVFVILSGIGLTIGATIGTYVFFGIATLLGLIAIAETNKYVRALIIRSNKFIDLLIFGATLYATAVLGVTISAALVFAGLGFSLVYAPFLRQREREVEEYHEYEEVTI